MISVAESTDADLASLRQTYEMQRAAGRDFPEYNPVIVTFQFGFAGMI
jgi:hypothetical protein